MWAYESVFYQIYPIGFCGAPRVNDGVLKNRIGKVADWAEHIAKLGCNAVYFSPLFESDSHGYDTRDFRKIDCRLGTKVFRHGLYGYGKVFRCCLTVQRKLRSQFHLNRILSCCRTGYFTSVIKAVIIHGFIRNHICIIGCPVNDYAVLPFFYKGKIASYIIFVLNSQSIFRLLKKRT